MEIFDICDEYGQPTGQTVSRQVAHRDGIGHRTAHIWVIRSTDEGYKVLLQKRAMSKDSFPGCYDTSAAGHIQAGDEPLESALRELSEELGIFAEEEDLSFAGTFRIQYESQFHGKIFRDNEVAFVYIYEKPVEICELTLQKEELDSVEWFGLKKTYDAVANKDYRFCVPPGGIETVINYLKDTIREV